ncbi:MAG: hypothetical protein AB7O57_21970 [Hyphomicrobiaceae bacterium]
MAKAPSRLIRIGASRAPARLAHQLDAVATPGLGVLTQVQAEALREAALGPLHKFKFGWHRAGKRFGGWQTPTISALDHRGLVSIDGDGKRAVITDTGRLALNPREKRHGR